MVVSNQCKKTKAFDIDPASDQPFQEIDQDSQPAYRQKYDHLTRLSPSNKRPISRVSVSDHSFMLKPKGLKTGFDSRLFSSANVAQNPIPCVEGVSSTTSQVLFNLLQVDVRVWDLRSIDDYNANHFFLAQPWPTTNDPSELSTALDEIEEDWPCDHFHSTILIYDDDSKHLIHSAADFLKDMGNHLGWRNTSCLSISHQEIIKNLSFLCTDKTEIENDLCYPAQITENVYLGSQLSAKQKPVLNKLGITHIINATNECPNFFDDNPKINYLKIGLDDHPDQNLLASVPKAIDFIDSAIDSNGKVLVHCSRGMSRSASLVAAWMMNQTHCTYPQAIDHIKANRFGANPNSGFRLQLRDLEEQQD